MEGGSLVILLLMAVLVARGYARSRPPGYQITLRDRVLVGLTVWAISCSAIGAAVVFRFKFAPEVTLFDRIARGLMVVGIGLAPLAILLLITCALRVVRYWENAYRNRHSS